MQVTLNIIEASPNKAHKAIAGTADALVASQGPRARPLQFWRETLKASGGTMPGPDGKIYKVSLDRWADADPGTTMLAIYFQFIDPALVGTTDPNPRR
jgi:hypothetical protein